MSATASATSPEVEVFRHQAGVVRWVVRLNLEGVTHEESLVRPSPAGNCMNWVLGHLLYTYGASLPLVGREPVLPREALDRYARGSAPLEAAGEALPLAELLAAWDETSARLEAGLAELEAEALDRPAPFSPTQNPDETVRTLLGTILFHQAYHAGQLGLLRRIAGKEGAIR